MYLGGSCLLWSLSRVVWLTSSLGESLGQCFSFWSHSGKYHLLMFWDWVGDVGDRGLSAWHEGFHLSLPLAVNFLLSAVPVFLTEEPPLFFTLSENSFLLGLENHLCWEGEQNRLSRDLPSFTSTFTLISGGIRYCQSLRLLGVMWRKLGIFLAFPTVGLGFSFSALLSRLSLVHLFSSFQRFSHYFFS